MKQHRAWTMAVGVALAAGPAAARDGAPSATVTNTLTSEWRAEPPGELTSDDQYGFFLDRLNIVGSAGDLTTNLRVDGMYFIDPDTAGLRSDSRVERVQVRYNLGKLKLTVGDYFKQLGRGLVLSLRKVDELGVDVSLRGGDLAWSGPTLQGSLFAGRVNPANVDLVSQRFLEDTEDIMVGGHGRVAAGAGLFVGGHALFMEREEPIAASEGDDRNTTVGLTFEAPTLTDWLAVYAEGNLQQLVRAGQDSHQATASYVAIDITPPDWAFLIEGLHLNALDHDTLGFEQVGGLNQATQQRFRYNNIPTLERIDMEVSNVEDVVGGRLRAERFFLDGDLVFHANGLFKLEDQGEGEAEVRVLHGFGGFEYVYGQGASRITTNGGYRQAYNTAREEVVKVIAHYDLDWVQHLTGAYGIHLQSLNQFRQLEQGSTGGQLDDNVRGSTLLSVDKAGLGSLTFELGYDTQSQRGRTLFYAGILRYDANDWLQIRSTVGTQRGGIKCIAGICRNFPEFSGAQLTLIIRHGLTSF
ncbi:MAG: hypothetical protein H6702_19650 [Myxococcales bacterium]|nr:hypothetical protein [Myxococcales bacterium]